RLSLRPLTELIECLNTAGANITTNEDTIIIKKGHLKTSTLHIDSSRSSQFLSSVLMLTSSKDIKVKASQVPSKSYIKMTEDVLGLFGYNLLIKDDNQWSVQKSGGEVVGHLDICLDPDYSTLCYVLFRSFLLSEEVALPKMTNIYQPDYDFIDIIKKMGVNIGYHKSQHSITFGEKGIITKTELFFDMADMPDQIITLSFWSLFLHAPTHITGCATLIYKESDRIAGILANIKLLGGKAEYKEGCLTIFPLQTEPQKCTLQTYNDHRFALTFLVLKEKWSYLEIDNIDCINKSAQIF
ncbi:MAG: hypothetical protein FWG20_04230, partial [Candidatus Cloacimonetes bacterium]|nr:hypothetical protein [Candidatus Cloacimonadota bacterium]